MIFFFKEQSDLIFQFLLIHRYGKMLYRTPSSLIVETRERKRQITWNIKFLEGWLQPAINPYSASHAAYHSDCEGIGQTRGHHRPAH